MSMARIDGTRIDGTGIDVSKIDASKIDSSRIEQACLLALEDCRGLEGPLLPILHHIQADLGHVPEEVVPHLATALNLSRAEIHGVISFYHDFRQKPGGRSVLRLCRAEACQSMGAEGLAEALHRRLGLSFGETTASGALTLEPVFCLGLCCVAPAAMLDGQPHGRLDEEALLDLVEAAGR